MSGMRFKEDEVTFDFEAIVSLKVRKPEGRIGPFQDDGLVKR